MGLMMVVLGIVGVSAAAGGVLWQKLLKPFSRSLELSQELDPVRCIPTSSQDAADRAALQRFAGSSASMSESLTRLSNAVSPKPGSAPGGSAEGDMRPESERQTSTERAIK
jgi:hypothetical protein